MRRIIKILGVVSVFALLLVAGLFIGANNALADAGTGWAFTEPPISSSADLTSLALNSNDYPGIAYIQSNNLYYRECMSGDCTVASNWNSATLVAAGASSEVVLHYNKSNDPVIYFRNGGSANYFAHYVGGSSGTCAVSYSGSNAWNCDNVASLQSGSSYYFDFASAPHPTSGNDVYYIVGRGSGNEQGFVYCEDTGSNVCDTVSGWNGYELTVPGQPEASKVAAEGNYVHIAYYESEGTNEIYYQACDISATDCDAAGDWTYVSNELVAVQGTYYSPQLMDLTANNGDVGILFTLNSTSNITPYSTSIQYLEYVGSGGNGSGSPWSGSSKWNGTQVYNQNTGRYDGSLDYSSVYGIMIGLRNPTNNTANLLTCSSNCEGSWDSDWTDTIVFDSDDPNAYGYSTIGNDSKVLVASNGYPRFSFNGSNFYGQEDDEPEPAEVPELPANNIWKVLVAVLALGLVIGVAAFMKKKK